MLLEVFIGIEPRSGLQHDDTQSALGEHLRGSPASGTRPNDADVIYLFGRADLQHLFSPVEL